MNSSHGEWSNPSIFTYLKNTPDFMSQYPRLCDNRGLSLGDKPLSSIASHAIFWTYFEYISLLRVWKRLKRQIIEKEEGKVECFLKKCFKPSYQPWLEVRKILFCMNLKSSDMTCMSCNVFNSKLIALFIPWNKSLWCAQVYLHGANA